MMNRIASILPSFLICLVFWGILAWSMHKDRSRYRNCVLFFLAIVFTVPFLYALAGKGQGAAFITGILTGVFFLMIMVLPTFLMANGATMIKKEGLRTQNLLSFALGLSLLVAEFSGVLMVAYPYLTDGINSKVVSSFSLFGVFVIITIMYGSFCFAIFTLYTSFLQVIPKRKDFDYVIIHGAGLLDGNRVSKLLSDRLNKAIEVYRKDPTPPYLIPSGGQGKDESVSEAEAMRGYLVKHGIPEEKILLEDKSKTTFENIENSKTVIENHGGAGSYIALVTSNYHVYRALRYCRKVGLTCTGIGAHVASYYWPSALIREFIAIHRETKHLIIFLSGWLVSLIPFFLLLAEHFH